MEGVAGREWVEMKWREWVEMKWRAWVGVDGGSGWEGVGGDEMEGVGGDEMEGWMEGMERVCIRRGQIRRATGMMDSSSAMRSSRILCDVLRTCIHSVPQCASQY
jgi:hypothetical protein